MGKMYFKLMEDFIHKNQSYMPINFKLYTIRVFMYELKISQKQIKINACELFGGGNWVSELSMWENLGV